MALHTHRSSRHALHWWTVLGHPDVPSRLPLRPPSNSNVHTLRAFPTLIPPLPLYLRLPSQIIQPCLGSVNNLDRPHVLHDERRDDDWERQRNVRRAEMGGAKVTVLELYERQVPSRMARARRGEQEAGCLDDKEKTCCADSGGDPGCKRCGAELDEETPLARSGNLGVWIRTHC